MKGLERLLNHSTNFLIRALKGSIEKKLQKAPILGYSIDEGMYSLKTDASLTEIAAILTQKQQGRN